MDVDQLLTTTRSARKALDLHAPVEVDVIRECLRIGMQAANGSNQQSWRWLVISDPGLRDKVAALYRDAYLARVGGQFIAELLGGDTAGGRLMSSTEWLVQNLARVPLFVIPCYEPYIPRIEGDDSFFAATLYGSIFPAVWNFQLALHSRCYGTCVTTLHLAHEEAVRDLLGIPDTYIQGCLLPVARLRAGLTFRPALRRADRGSRRRRHLGGADIMNARFQELCDRADILDCMYRYARGMDRLDRELLRSAYHDDAVDDHVGFVGPVDDFIDWAFAYHATQTRHQHYLMNHTADIAGDEAHSETYYVFVGTDRDPDKPLIISGGRYVDRLARRDGRWAIVARVCLVEWQSESGSLLPPDAIAFLDSVQTVSRDSRDNSSDRPLNITRVPLST